MIPVDQEFLVGDGSGRMGDCLRACAASLLGLPRGDVPHFAEDADWLGFTAEFFIGLGFQFRWDNPASFPVEGVMSQIIAIGMSPRAVVHAVIADAHSGDLIHDPHPSRAGLSSFPTATISLVRR